MKNFLSLVVVWSFIPTGVLAQGSPVVQFKTAADLVAHNIPNVSTRLSVLLTGVATENDGKGGLFFYQASSAVATNTHSIFKPAGSGGRWLRATINIAEEDGSPSVLRFTGLKFTNATVTDNGDGTVSIAVGGAGGSTAWDAIGDPSGAGTVSFGATVQTITGSGSLNLDLPVNFGTAGVQISNDGDGAITLLGLGNGSDENFTLNLDDTANTLVISSSTGLNLVDWGAIGADFDSSTITLSTVLGVVNAGAATSFELPNNNNPTVAVAGQVHVDVNDDSLRIFGTQERVIPTMFTASVTIFDPDGVQATSDAVPLLPVEATWAPFGITIRDIYLKTDASSTYSIELEEWTAMLSPTVTSIEIVATSATAEAEDDGTLTDSSIAAGSIVFADLPATAANFITITFTYTINAGN